MDWINVSTVQGSTSNEYKIAIRNQYGVIVIGCSCRAWCNNVKNAQKEGCKHIKSLYPLFQLAAKLQDIEVLICSGEKGDYLNFSLEKRHESALTNIDNMVLQLNRLQSNGVIYPMHPFEHYENLRFPSIRDYPKPEQKQDMSIPKGVMDLF